MKWTEATPTEPGYFWIRAEGYNDTVLLLYVPEGTDLLAAYDTSSGDSMLAETYAEVIEGPVLWAGPVPHPDDVQEF